MKGNKTGWVGNLVRYAGDYWVTLTNMTDCRDVRDYSNLASVKSAIRTFVVNSNPNKYIAFRGEVQLKNIAKENSQNPLFNAEEFKGHTRTALIHWSMVDDIDEKFPIASEFAESYWNFKTKARTAIQEKEEAQSQNNDSVDSPFQGRSSMIRQLREELKNIDAEIEVLQDNREKLLQALNAIESIELVNY